MNSNKDDNPPKSIPFEEKESGDDLKHELEAEFDGDLEEFLNEILGENLDDEEDQIEWDGSKAELVPDEDVEKFEDNLAGIKISYVLRKKEIYYALCSSKSYKKVKIRLIVESMISCIMSAVFFITFNMERNWLTLIFAVLCLLLSVIIWISAWYSLNKNARRLTNRERIQMEIYPSLIEMGKDESKWIIPLDGTVSCRKVNHLFVLQTDKTHITILPLRCIDPSVLPDVEAIILSGTN